MTHDLHYLMNFEENNLETRFCKTGEERSGQLLERSQDMSREKRAEPGVEGRANKF